MPALRRDNVDVSSRARTRGEGSESRRGERGSLQGEGMGANGDGRERKERYALLTKFQGVSRDFNSFRAGEDCARRDATRRDARIVYGALPMRPRTFIATESEFLLYAGSHSVLPPDRLRNARSGEDELLPANRIPLGIGPRRETPENAIASLYTLSSFRRIESARFLSVSRVSARLVRGRAIYADLARYRARHLRDCDNCDGEIERLRELRSSFSLSLSSSRPFGDRSAPVHLGTELVRGCTEIITAVSLERSARARFFGTFQRFQDPPRRTGKATLGRLVNPPLLVNPTVIPSEDASAAGLATAGQRGRERKKNYDRHGSRITLGNRPRRTPEVAVVDIGNYFDPRLPIRGNPDSPGPRSGFGKGFDERAGISSEKFLGVIEN